jgi:transcriptional regulator with XRE-family HTH domain
MSLRSSIPLPVLTGAEIKRRRIALKLSQAALADMVGIHEQSLSKIERGAKAITLPNARHYGLLFAWIEKHGATVEVAVGPDIVRTTVAPIPTLAREPAYKWLNDEWTKDITNPVMQVLTNARYWESQLRPDGSLGPWRQKIRALTSDCRTDAFTNEPERIPD